MIKIIVHCDRCGGVTTDSLETATDLWNGARYTKTETGYALCAECHRLYFDYRRAVKEELDKKLNKKLHAFVHRGK